MAERSKSLATQVAAAGGVDAWNAKNPEMVALSTIIDSMCKATTVDEALTEVKAIMLLGHDLWAHAYMRKLYYKNDALYYGVLMKDPVTLLPVVYTPTVGEACQKFGKLPMGRRGCYLSIADRTNIRAVLEEYAMAELEKGPDGKPICECIVFSDGGRILGLGDLGAWGMGIPIGKLDLYCVCAGVNPNRTIPLIIDAGCGDSETNSAKLVIRDHPLYTGLKQDRVVQKSKAGTIVNKPYHEDNGFIQQFMQAATEVFGPQVLLQFEDFNSNDAFPLLANFRDKFVSYNDDIQGTASIAVAGLFGAMRLKKPSLTNLRDALKQETFLFHGAGSANIGSMRLLVELGVPKAQIFVTNSRGVIWKTEDGSDGSFRNDEQKEFARVGKPPYDAKDLELVIKTLKATCLIGAVGRDPNCFTKPIVEAMVETCKPHRPIIFALSNPKTQAELTSDDAYEWSGGTVIYGSGTKMPNVTVQGQLRVPAQVNNVYIFPGVSLAVAQCKATTVPENFFLVAAEAVANTLDVEDMRADRVLPNMNRIREVGLNVATAVVLAAQQAGLAKVEIGPDEITVKRNLHAKMWVPAGSEALHAGCLVFPAPPASPRPSTRNPGGLGAPVAPQGSDRSATKKTGRLLPVDSELNDELTGSGKIRAVKVTVDKKRPRFIEAGTIPASGSLAKDFEKVSKELNGKEAMGVLVFLPDQEGALAGVANTDWVFINYVPTGLKKKDELMWNGAGDSFISNYPEKRISEWRVSSPDEVSYFAFCEVAKTVLQLSAM